MNYYVYILFSPSLAKFYTGMSKFSAKRKRQHVKGQSQWTSMADDWIEIWRTDIEDSIAARKLESSIKKRGAKRFLLDNNIAVPPLAE
jgi:putative endonuclease